MSSQISKPEILVLGDSHVRSLLGGKMAPDQELIVDHGSFVAKGKQLGSTGATIWGLPELQSATNAGEKIRECLKDKTDVLLYLSLGEVDVRAHYNKNADNKMKPVVDRYKDWLEQNVLEHVDKLFLQGSIPYSDKFAASNGGNDLKNASLDFNDCLQQMLSTCKKMYYIDMYKVLDKDLVPEDEIRYDSIHLDINISSRIIIPQIERYI